MRKANAIIEYTFIIAIVISALAGMNAYLKRVVQAHIKRETDEHLYMPSSFLWQSSVTFRRQETEHDRREYAHGDTVVNVTSRSPSVSLHAPSPPGVPVAGIHAQDAASAPPGQSNPSNPTSDEQTEVPAAD
ncbi:MAG: hypothetical protein WCI77_05615 [Candidatus Omnitrophota bacterium]